MPRLALVVGLLVACASCYEPNPASCELAANAGKGECPDAATSGGSCKTDDNCLDKTNFPACDTAVKGGTCFKCTAGSHALCTGETPHCDNHECVACVDDNDCDAGAGVCLATGSCAALSSIIHAIPNGAGGSCGGVSSPCSLDAALVIAKNGPKVIKLDDAGTYTSATNFVVDVDVPGVTIDARNATLHRNSNGPIFTINDGKAMTILGGTIENATGSGAEGIRCGNNAILAAYGTTIRMNEGPGINAPNGGTLTLSRSLITSNRGGGLSITSGKFIIVGNVFFNNGDANSTYGGVAINTGLDSMNRMEFNSISGNHAQVGGNAPGVQCTAGVGFVIRNNIVWGNNDNIGTQIGGNCKHAYSDIGLVGVLTLNDGGNNQNVDPMFSSDLHLMPSSMLRQKADPSAKLDSIAARDIDGEPRIAPADLGADQVPRP